VVGEDPKCLTRRQSQRRDLSRLVLVAVLAISNGAAAHESRQLPSWLIFDVRQKMRSSLSSSVKWRSRWSKVSFAAVVFSCCAFLFADNGIRGIYRATASKQTIGALRQHYHALEAAEFRLRGAGLRRSMEWRFEIAAWLKMRGVQIDAGLRDEAVEHGSLLQFIAITSWWSWEDIARYWSSHADHKTTEFLLRAIDQEPNKAPEPTTTSVTRRAFEHSMMLEHDSGARRAPAVVVAHL
jgi:hypothetical protein